MSEGKTPLVPVYTFNHFAKDKDTGKVMGKPVTLSLFSEAGIIERGYAKKGGILFCLDNGKPDKEHQKIWFKCEISEVCELFSVLGMLIDGHIKGHSSRVMKAAEEYQAKKPH